MSPDRTFPHISHAAVDTDEELVGYSERALRRAVADYPLSVDLSRLREVTVSARAKRRAAAVSYVPVPGAAVGERPDWTSVHDDHADRLAGTDFEDFRECSLRLSRRAFDAFDEAEWRRTLRHELVHVEQVQTYGTTGHGPAFADRCETLETTRHCPSFHVGRYRIACRGCGETRYDRCRRCKLTRIADSSVKEQRRRVQPSECCEAYYRLVEADDA